ncbi:MAG: hypothetical protein ACLFWH_13880 [Actinomycetota bacterium]
MAATVLGHRGVDVEGEEGKAGGADDDGDGNAVEALLRTNHETSDGVLTIATLTIRATQVTGRRSSQP